MRKKSRQTLPALAYLETAYEILVDIVENDLSSLPTLHAFAARYKKSQKTVSAALNELRERGLIRSSPRRGTEVVRKPKTANAWHESRVHPSTYAVFERIQSDISTGIYRVGEALPKVQFFTLSYHVSQHTIVEAFKMLQRNSLIHKRGMRWIVGRTDTSRESFNGFSPVASHVKPTVIFLWPDANLWNKHWTNSLDNFFPFAENLVNELEKFGYALTHACSHGPNEKDSFLSASASLYSRIRSLGSRFAGIFMFFSRDSDARWVEWISELNKPFVCFFAENARKKVSLRPQQFAYCQYSHAGAAQKTVDLLVALGHRRIGIVLPVMKGFEWARNRYKAIRMHAERKYPDVTLLVREQNEQIWLNSEAHDQETFRPYLEKCVQDLCRQQDLTRRKALRKLSPSLASLIDSDKPTVVVAMTDSLARMYGVWLSEMGITYPARISLLGFDNDMVARFSDISSVDFRFQSVGYLVAHYFIKDIPVQTDRTGRINIESTYVDRGSVRKV